MIVKFTVRKICFGEPPASDDDEADEGGDLPRPHLVRLQARRMAGIAEAKEALLHLPAPGESLHAIMTARLDLTDNLNAILQRLGRCENAFISTLGFNRRNFRTMLGWLDGGMIGSLSLVASLFFRSHNGDLAQEVIEEFRSRGQRAVFCPCHAKVMALFFQDGTRLALEGSSNLCSNGSSLEQFCIVNDPALCGWHSRWIDSLVSNWCQKYEGRTNESEPRTG